MKLHLKPVLASGFVLGALAMALAHGGGASSVSASDDKKPASKTCSTGEARIDVVGYRYMPLCGCKENTPRSKVCTVDKGTRVIWQFADEDPHDTASVDGRFPSSARIKTGTYSYTFAKPGSYEYYCSIHRTMKGYSVVVR